MATQNNSGRLPVLFLGHGNPMNAIEENGFTRRLATLGQELPRPKALLVVSAHWMTRGTWVTRMDRPRTIHDFYGFPQALFDVQYPAPGSPEVADRVRSEVSQPSIGADEREWGLDHGTWSVLKHMYPAADIPTVQLSLDMSQPSGFHYELGTKLRALRDQGVMIVGSGNIVHNLRQINFNDGVKPFDWAVEFDEWVKKRLLDRDHASLRDQATTTAAGKLSVPTPDHWYPLLYVLGAADPSENLRFEHEGIDHGSISMRCLSLGRT